MPPISAAPPSPQPEHGSDRTAWTTSEERQNFDRDGFVVLDRPVLGAVDLAEVRGLVEKVVSRSGTVPSHLVKDLGEGDPSGGPILEVLRSAGVVPELWRTMAFRRCRDIAAEVLGEAVEPAYEHVIVKPAGSPSWTAWHQDTAYLEPGEPAPHAITTWLALSEVPVAMGCMQFIPGSQRTVLPHRPRGGQAGNLVLEVVDPQTCGAVAAPLPAGGLTLHHPNVLHATGPNDTTRTRAAWIIQFRPGRTPGLAGRLPAPVRDRIRGRRRPSDLDDPPR